MKYMGSSGASQKKVSSRPAPPSTIKSREGGQGNPWEEVSPGSASVRRPSESRKCGPTLWGSLSTPGRLPDSDLGAQDWSISLWPAPVEGHGRDEQELFVSQVELWITMPQPLGTNCSAQQETGRGSAVWLSSDSLETQALEAQHRYIKTVCLRLQMLLKCALTQSAQELDEVDPCNLRFCAQSLEWDRPEFKFWFHPFLAYNCMFSFFFLTYWSIVYLQCCISGVQQSDLVIHTQLLFSDSFLIQVLFTEYWIEFTML